MSTANHRRRLDRIEEALADDDAADDLPVLVMCGPEQFEDPRLSPLVAQARAEGRLVVMVGEDTDTGELVDTCSAAYLAAQPAHVVHLPQRDDRSS